MLRVLLLSDQSKHSIMQFCNYDMLPPDVKLLGYYKRIHSITKKLQKYKMYGYGIASPKWKKKCS